MADYRWLADWCRQRADEATATATLIARSNPTSPDASFARGRAVGFQKAAELFATSEHRHLRAVADLTARQAERTPHVLEHGMRGLASGLRAAVTVLDEQIAETARTGVR